MREIPYAEKQVRTEEGKMLTLSYSLVVSGGDGEPEFYGVKIVEHSGGGGAQVLGVTVDTERIETLIESLARNSVTPVGLMDVLADWL